MIGDLALGSIVVVSGFGCLGGAISWCRSVSLIVTIRRMQTLLATRLSFVSTLTIARSLLTVEVMAARQTLSLGVFENVEIPTSYL